MAELIMPYVIQLVATIIIVFIGIAGTWLLDKMTVNKNISNITAATEQVIAATKVTVAALQQMLVDGWKEANGGKLTDAQIDTLRNKVVEITKESLANSTIKLLEGAKADVPTIISMVAEQYIPELKKNAE